MVWYFTQQLSKKEGGGVRAGGRMGASGDLAVDEEQAHISSEIMSR